jgi:thiol-disulfide isomerase/thioredoxin
MVRHFFSVDAVCLAIAILIGSAAGLHASPFSPTDAPKPGEPTELKARKSYAEALEYLKQGRKRLAMMDFVKANKQDNDHCLGCLNRAYTLAIEEGDLKDADEIVRDCLSIAKSVAAKAILHFQLGLVLEREGQDSKKDSYFTDSSNEFRTALQLDPSISSAHFGMGLSLAHLHQDDAARAEFKTFLDNDKDEPQMHARAKRFFERVELARAKMAPPFSLTTLDGRHVSMDDLTGRVLLIDFWATWCGPCREALPHIRRITQEFNGQPLVVLSVSLDSDEAKWKSFVTKNEMTWPQYRDGDWNGQMAKLFSVTAIPATFSIDADGVLEDQHVGEANIEGKLKKMIGRAVELSNEKAKETAEVKPSGAEN